MQVSKINQFWSMDFVACQTCDGRKIRGLTVVDILSHKCLVLHPQLWIWGDDVVSIMDRLKSKYGMLPQRIQVDNGSEFISKALDKWSYENHVTQDF